MNTDYLEKILEYWIHKYDVTKRVELLNQFPHYKTTIQGLDIHFIRVTPQVKEGVKVFASTYAAWLAKFVEGV